ncbi:hypothetical protein NDU88_010159 [Pleurodeles waltl]|uniref:Uncharacterized protein n=1 Tax=Pleurodeles waltl TaxID=8319 RepID=A0AAV7S0G3_PLEWA|nr:hypothetical protein NDU88_010159 [Pleurodeles waltl]
MAAERSCDHSALEVEDPRVGGRWPNERLWRWAGADGACAGGKWGIAGQVGHWPWDPEVRSCVGELEKAAPEDQELCGPAMLAGTT